MFCVPPAGFEPALPPPEGGALSPELRGRHDPETVAERPPALLAGNTATTPPRRTRSSTISRSRPPVEGILEIRGRISTPVYPRTRFRATSQGDLGNSGACGHQ